MYNTRYFHGASITYKKLSFPFNECPLLPQIPSSSFRNIYTFAEYVSNSCQISGLTVIFDGEKTINVQKSFGKDKLMYTCVCQKCCVYDGLRGHVLAVADKCGESKELIQNYVQYGGKVNRIVNKALPKKGGDKSHQKKKRTGRNNR